MSEAETQTSETREAFDRKVKEKDLLGYWMIPTRSNGYREPTPKYGPHVWPWATMQEILNEAVDNVPKEEAHRRFIGYQHPDLQGEGTTPNLMMGAQMLIPGEEAPCHRHTMDAIRFVVKGDGTTSTVQEGEQFPMFRGDLIVTPNWSWHDHVSTSEDITIWLDGAVAPMIVHFGIGFAEPHQAPQQTVYRPKHWSDRQFGPIRPKNQDFSKSCQHPCYRYSWEDTKASLDMLAEGEGDPWDAVSIVYTEPTTGGPTLPTASCEMMMLRGHEKTKAQRHTYAPIYHVFEGKGSSVINGERVHWEKGDSFVVPSWAWYAHENEGNEPAFLFSFNDEPVMQSLGFDRKERET